MRTNWVLIGLLYAVGLLAAAQFAKIAVSLEALELVFPGTPVPFAVSALSLIGIVFGVTAGIFVGKVGPRRVILAGLVASCATSCLQALLPPFPMFLGLRLAEGAAHLALVIATPTLMAAITHPKDTSVAMGVWGTFFGVGFALTALVAKIITAPATLYLAHGLLALGLAVVLWRLIPRQGGGSKQNGVGFLAMHMEIYTSLKLVAPAAIFFWHTATFLGLLTFMPRFLGDWTAPVLPLAALLGTLGAGVLARNHSPVLIAGAGFLLTALGMSAIAASPAHLSALIALPVFVVAGIPAGASFATGPWLNTDPTDRARANGAITQTGNIGTAISTPLFAAALPLGVYGPLGLAITLSLSGFIVAFLLHKNLATRAVGIPSTRNL